VLLHNVQSLFFKQMSKVKLSEMQSSPQDSKPDKQRLCLHHIEQEYVVLLLAKWHIARGTDHGDVNSAPWV
jgi:hypothetical protein